MTAASIATNDQKPATAAGLRGADRGAWLALEQVLAVTKGSDKKELANAYLNYMLAPDNQKKLAEGRMVLAGQQEGRARAGVSGEAADHRGQGRDLGAVRLEVVQRARPTRSTIGTTDSSAASVTTYPPSPNPPPQGGRGGALCKRHCCDC